MLSAGSPLGPQQQRSCYAACQFPKILSSPTQAHPASMASSYETAHFYRALIDAGNYGIVPKITHSHLDATFGN